MGERRATALALLILVAIPLLVVGEALLPGQVLASHGTATQLPWLSSATPEELAAPQVNFDTLRENLAYRIHLHETLGRGEIPWWTPHMFGGIPFVALNHTQVLYPLTWLFLPLDPHLAFGALNFVHLVLAGLGAFAWLRAEGRSVPAALVGALAFQLNGMFATRHGHPQFVATGAWIPFALLGVSWLCDRKPWGFALVAAATALMILAGHPSVYVFGGWFIAAFLLLRLLDLPWRERGRVVGATVLAGAIGVALAAPQLLATLELSHASARAAQSLEALTAALSHWTHLLRAVFPDVTGSKVAQDYWSLSPTSFTAGMLYMGVPPLLLGALGAVWGERRARLLALFGLGVLAVLFLPPVFELAWRLLPGFQFSRVDRFSIAWFLALTWLAARGVDRVLEGEQGQQTAAWALAGVGLLLGGITLLLVPRVAASAAIADFDPSRLRAGVAWGLGLWGLTCAWIGLAGRGGPRPLLVGGLVALVAVDVVTFASPYAVARDADRLLRTTPAIDFLQSQEPPFRVLKFGGGLPDAHLTLFPANLPMAFGIEDIHGFAPMHMSQLDILLRPVEEGLGRNPWFLRPLEEPASLEVPTLDLLAAPFVLSATPIEARDHLLVHAGEDLWIYENRRALPRALFVPEFEIQAGLDAGAARLAAGDIDPRQTVLLHREPPRWLEQDPARGGEGAVTLRGRSATSLTLDKTGPGAGHVLVLDPWYPGWRAEVGGEPAPLLRANVMFRAIPVPAGDHEVRLDYRPEWFGRARLLTLLGGLGLLGGLAGGFLRARRR